MKIKLKLTLSETLAIVGVVATVAGELMLSASGDEKLSPGAFVRILGLAVFLGSIFAFLTEVSKQVRALGQSQEAQVREMRDYQEKALKTLSVAETTSSLSDISAWCKENPRAVHVWAASEVATRLFRSYIPGMVRSVTEFCAQPGQGGFIDVEDQSPVHDLLANLAAGIPPGGVWLGVTLLEQEKTWSRPDQAFARFAETIRTRVKSGEVTVARIYHFTSDAAEDAMRASLQGEMEKGIHVRWTAGGDRRDMSILLAPPSAGEEPIPSPPGKEFVNEALRAGYRVICAVAFETRADGALRKATVYGEQNPRTQEMVSQFAVLWGQATPPAEA